MRVEVWGRVRWARNVAWLLALLLAVGAAPHLAFAQGAGKSGAQKFADWWSENFEVHGFATTKSYLRSPDYSYPVQLSSWRTEFNFETELRLYRGDDLRLGLYGVIRPIYDAIYEIQPGTWGESADEAAFGTAPAYPDDPGFARASKSGRDLPCAAGGLAPGCQGGQVRGEFTIVNSDTGSFFSGELVPAVSIDNVVFFGRVTAPVRPRGSGQDWVGGNATGKTYEELHDNFGDLIPGFRPGEPGFGALHNGGLPDGLGLDASLHNFATMPLDTPLNAYQGAIGDRDSLEQSPFDINRKEMALRFDCLDNAHPLCMLREMYFDLEWKNTFVRLGRQQIVWGKTDAFRLQDKLNPVDLGYHNVFPDLEERRIPQLALDVVQSFGNVGPLEDVSLEFAWIFDRFLPDQFGQCGEPYAFTQACQARADAGGHQLFNFALAGVDKLPWNFKNTEPALRFEARIPDPSIGFSLSVLYTHQDLPVAKFTGHYSVDNPNPAAMLFLQGIYSSALGAPVAQVIDGLATASAIYPAPHPGGSSGAWLAGFDPYAHAADGSPEGSLLDAGYDLENAYFMLMNVLPPAAGGCAGLTVETGLAQCAGAVATFAMPWTATEATLKFPRIWSLGASMDYQIPGIDAVLRLEMAADLDRRIQNTVLYDQVDRSHVFQAAIGFDRPTFIPFLNPNRTALISLQMFFEHIIDYDDGYSNTTGMVPWETTIINTVFMQNYWRNDSIILTNFVAVDWWSEAVIYGPSLKWILNDNLYFEFGLNLLWGKKQQHNLRDLCPDGGIDGATCSVRNPATWQAGQWQMLNAGVQEASEHPFWGKESFADRFMRKRDEFWLGVTYQF